MTAKSVLGHFSSQWKLLPFSVSLFITQVLALSDMTDAELVSESRLHMVLGTTANDLGQQIRHDSIR